MRVEEFVKLLPPPEEPVGVPVVSDWALVERELGVELPDDYKAFLTRYGMGRIGNFMRIYAPGARIPNLNLLESWKAHSFILDEPRRSDVDVPFATFPERPGLLPCGGTDNGDSIYWLVDGSPSTWQIVIDETRGAGFELIEGRGLVAFLASALRHDRSYSIIPADLSPRFSSDPRSR